MKRILRFVLPILIILILFFSIGLIKPLVSYENEVFIERPVDKSFMVFTDVNKMGEWITGFKKMEMIKGMPTLPGSLIRMTMEINGKEIMVTEEVVEFKWNKIFSFRLYHKSMTIDCEYTFVSSEMNSEIHSNMTVKGKNLFWRSVNLFMKGKMKKQNQDDLDKLKALIEAS